MFLNFVGDIWGSLSIHPNVMVVTHFNFSRYPISREAPKFFPFSITVHLPIEYHFQYETICWWMNPRSLNQWIDPVGCYCCNGYESGAYGCVILAPIHFTIWRYRQGNYCIWTNHISCCLVIQDCFGDIDKEIIAFPIMNFQPQ